MAGNSDRKSDTKNKLPESQPLLNPDNIVFNDFVSGPQKLDKYHPKDKSDQTLNKTLELSPNELKHSHKPKEDYTEKAVNSLKTKDDFVEIDLNSAETKKDNSVDRAETKKSNPLSNIIKSVKKIVDKVIDSIKSALNPSKSTVTNQEKSKEKKPSLNSKPGNREAFSNTKDLGNISSPHIPSAKIHRDVGQPKN